MSIYINNNNGTVNHFEHSQVTINQGVVQSAPTTVRQQEPIAEDIEAVDTSFFCSQRFSPEICEKNLRQAITEAKSKADACRRIMALETQGYLLLSNVKDERKAELVNPFAAPKYVLTADDFCKARNS